MIDITKSRELWRQLHEFGTSNDTPKEQNEFILEWICSVKKLIRCKSCFRKLVVFLLRWPVEYGEGFYLWGLCLHDYINKELGKRLFYSQLTLTPLMGKGIIQ